MNDARRWWRLGILATMACSGSPEASPPPTAETAETPPPPEHAPSQVVVREVVFARELDDEWQPVGGPVTELNADDHGVQARVTLAGRPTRGVISTRWMWRDLLIASADIDLASLNGHVLFSFGQATFLRTFMTTPQLYIGDGHRLDLLMGEELLGSYPFRVTAPPGAQPSRFVSADIQATDPSSGDRSPTRSFRPDQPVFVFGRVALGRGSWFDAMFTVNGQPAPQLTQEAIGPEDGGDERDFSFRVHPDGGWPEGSHRVALVLDDSEVAAFDFTVAAP